MKRDTFTLPLGIAAELLIDNFAGGGGASTGIEQAFGRPVDVAINHDGEALAMHHANHSTTKHYREDVFTVHPGFVTQQQPIGLAWFSPDCFPADTMILTNHGYRPIQDIREGDEVLTHAGRYRRVYATMSARKPIHEIDIQGVPTIKVTAEHPFFAREMTNVWDNANRRYKRTLAAPGWVKATDLRDGPADMNAAGGDRHFCGTPCMFPSLPIPAIGGRGLAVDERLMWLAGRYVGDGWSRLTEDRAELVIICGKAEATALAQKLDVWPRENDRSKYGELAWHQRDTATAYQFSTNHRGLVEWLRTQFGHGGADKNFPAWALGCDEKLRRALLEGYVSADGSNLTVKAVGVVETVTISRALAFSTKSLAESLGFTTQVFAPIQNNTSIAGRAVNAKPIYRVRWRPSPLRHQTVRDGLHNWSRVQRVSEVVGEEEVFNISVEEDETYIADGIVVHNCKHHSKAKGGKPREKKIRGLAWVCLKWGTFQMPRAIAIENVEEFMDWGPLNDAGKPIKEEKGRTFRAFVDALSTGLDRNHPDVPEIFDALGADFPMERLYAGLGYTVEWKILRACDYGTPTIRKRLFIFARRDGLPIVWPAPTHGDPKTAAVKAGKLLPYRTAAECIDWSIKCPSIFERAKPLKEATLRRIAKGIMKFVVNSSDPFIVKFAENSTGQGADEPLHTVMAGAPRFGLVAPTVMHMTHQGADRNGSVEEPLPTVTGAHRGEQAMVSATLAPFITEHANASTQRNMPASEPLRTQCAEVKGGHFAVVSATLVDAAHGEESPTGVKRWGVGAHDIAKPLGTVLASGGNQALVTAMLAKHYGGVVGTGVDVPFGTVTTSDHHSVVTAQIVGVGGRAGQSRPRDASEPIQTITAKADSAVVTSHLVKLRNNQFGQAVDEPAPTLTAGGGHVGEVRAFLIKYYGADKAGVTLEAPLGTVPTHDRFGLVTVHGEEYQIVDIGMRMLTPRELARAQGFPDSYILDPVVNGKPLSKTAQVRMIGNSVCPPLARALLEANFTHEREIARVA